MYQTAFRPVAALCQIRSGWLSPLISMAATSCHAGSATDCNGAHPTAAAPLMNHTAFSPVARFRHTMSTWPSALKSPRAAISQLGSDEAVTAVVERSVDPFTYHR